MDTTSLHDLESAHAVLYLPAGPRTFPRAAPTSRLVIMPRSTALSLAAINLPLRIFIGTCGSDPLKIVSINWDGLDHYLNNRETVEQLIIGRDLFATGADLVLHLLFDRSLMYSNRRQFKVNVQAIGSTRNYGATWMLTLAAPHKVVAIPSKLDFGEVGRLGVRSVARPVSPPPFDLTLWAVKARTKYEYKISDDDPITTRLGAGDALYAVWHHEGGLRWAEGPLAEMAFTPAGLGRSVPHSARRLVLNLKSLDTAELQFRVTSQPRWICVKPDTFSLPPGDAIELDVLLREDMCRAGIYTGYVVLSETSGRMNLEIPVQVKFTACGPIVELPEGLDFGIAEPGAIVERRVCVANRGIGRLVVDVGDPRGPVDLAHTEVFNSDDRIDSATDLVLRLDPGRMNRHGPICLSIPVATNSQVVEQRVATLEAKVNVSSLHLLPAGLSMMSVACGDHLIIPCEIRDLNNQLVRISSPSLCVHHASPWSIGMVLRDDDHLNLEVHAPLDVSQPQLDCSLAVYDVQSGLHREFPVCAVAATPTAKLRLLLGPKPYREVADGECLRPSDLRKLALFIENMGEPRLLISSIRFFPQSGPRISALLSTPVLESGGRVECPLHVAWAWIRRLYREYVIKGTLCLRCHHFEDSIASMSVNIRIRCRKG